MGGGRGRRGGGEKVDGGVGLVRGIIISFSSWIGGKEGGGHPQSADSSQGLSLSASQFKRLGSRKKGDGAEIGGRMNGAALFARLFFCISGSTGFLGYNLCYASLDPPLGDLSFSSFLPPPPRETRGESFHLLSRGLEGSEKGGVFVFRGLPSSLPPQGSRLREKQFWCWRQEGEEGEGDVRGMTTKFRARLEEEEEEREAFLWLPEWREAESPI